MKILLQEVIQYRNLSVRQVSIMTGVPKSSIEDIINGRTSPRIDTLETLAKGLNVHITDLFSSPYK
ncbi:helix-turn-helix transcriptional regulator [Blautia coccoides]|uniref:helix-turn-helix domain-containing protein n=1 Tax=Blautia producta TaxID=33035 RepID=UPI0028A56576|nr:helix-turn-helix transcriptional regulator [Blautia coccoides]MDT4375457.1 helix-turn-helix transcriptional regulator [Blautia coccoides]